MTSLPGTWQGRVSARSGLLGVSVLDLFVGWLLDKQTNKPSTLTPSKLLLALTPPRQVLGSVLRLVEIASLICNCCRRHSSVCYCLSRSIPEVHLHTAGMLNSQPTDKLNDEKCGICYCWGGRTFSNSLCFIAYVGGSWWCFWCFWCP